MKKTNKGQMKRGPEFSNDILSEILRRLPAKPLGRFKCVSKAWLSLISSPTFIHLHLDQSIKNMSTIMFSTYGDTYTIDYQTPCYEPKECDFPLCDESIVGFCNGLMCLYAYWYLALWNPATSEYLQIEYGPKEDESVECEEQDTVLGFGYDDVLDEYKILRSNFSFSDSDHNEFLQCEVYVCTLRTMEWRKIGEPPCCLQNRHMVPSVNGALHWLGGLPIGSNSSEHKIISFDIHSEEFHVVPWIEDVVGSDSGVTIGVLQGCLSALVSGGNAMEIDVWMMKDYGVKESWTKLFSVQMPSADIEFSSMEPLVLRGNGEMLLKSSGELYCYNGENHALAATYCICEEEIGSCRAGNMYAESLISIKSLVGSSADEDSADEDETDEDDEDSS